MSLSLSITEATKHAKKINKRYIIEEEPAADGFLNRFLIVPDMEEYGKKKIYLMI